MPVGSRVRKCSDSPNSVSFAFVYWKITPTSSMANPERSLPGPDSTALTLGAGQALLGIGTGSSTGTAAAVFEGPKTQTQLSEQPNECVPSHDHSLTFCILKY